jgi:hypothetical protein
MSGGGGSTTVVQPAEPTPQEIELQQASLDVARAQLSAIEQQSTFQQQQFEALGPLIEQQVQFGEEAAARAAEFDPIQRELLDLELAAIRQGTAATPEQRALIGETTELAIASGEADIERFTGRGLELLREELAPSLGLRPTDTPILDRGARVAEEGALQQGQLVRSLRGIQAQAELNFPLAAGQFQSARVGAQQNISQAAIQFQNQLRQQAFQNRLSQTAQVGGGGLGLSSIPFSGAGTLAALSANRGSTTTQTGGGGSFLGGVGGLLTGAGTLIGAF